MRVDIEPCRQIVEFLPWKQRIVFSIYKLKLTVEFKHHWMRSAFFLGWRGARYYGQHSENCLSLLVEEPKSEVNKPFVPEQQSPHELCICICLYIMAYLYVCYTTYIYDVHTISFQTCFVWALLLIVHTWNSSPLRSNFPRL